MAQINIRVDDEIKKIGRGYKIPFELSADPFYSETNINYLEEQWEKHKIGGMEILNHELIEDED
ncbi:type II toxin-antitoxin system antitoxin, RelB/DinJ family [uncultured Anaerococcus sp.]|uniref:type II toxin-antitoxin system antitoxin, RelB/DinJ family n=1 Tax=uncultured Anaerococcus sp. TaxID=293428 RepID=UPI00288A77E1|nr:type II toxin-antitoxin system antitoxin, RelB/DinJ family [uncultured Anaerococcus sp.]